MSYRTTKADVIQMFGRIAHRYDMANGVLSLGVHKYWRNVAFDLLRSALGSKKVETALDVCTGTGALLEGLGAIAHEVVGVDICAPMLQSVPAHLKHIRCIQADAEDLPFGNSSFDVVSVGFGIRNFEHLECGLKEMRRVLKNGGYCMILEFGEIRSPIMRALFNVYSICVMPFVGRLLTGDKAAYEYLPQTAKKFPSGEALVEILKKHHLEVVKWQPLTFGLCYVYIARAV